MVKISATFALLVCGTSVLSSPLKSLQSRALPFLGGINLAGCDFGMDTSGNSGTSYCPGTDQITHFASDGVKLFRIPVGWQYLVGGNQASTSFDATFLATYDNLVQAALATGGYVMIDIHNYGRWNGGVVGQGGASNTDFANLWSLIAKKYASQSKVIFGLMNEPHDLDMTLWAATCQAAVNAIRAAGATTQTIALPGGFYSHADYWYNGNNNPMLTITDPATGDNSLLILDVHAYLDSDFSGGSPICSTNGVANLQSLSTFLSANGRRAILSETGGGDPSTCIPNLGAELAYVAGNPNFVGFAVWSAGSFATYPSYALSIVPTNGVDTQLFTQAIKPYLAGKGGFTPSSSVVVSAPASSSSVAASSGVLIATSSTPSSSTAIVSSASQSSSSISRLISSSNVSASSSVRPSSSSRAGSTSSTSVRSTSVSVSKSVTQSTSSISVKTSSVITSSGKTGTTQTKTSISSAAASTSSTSGVKNYQTYTGSLGSIPAPSVRYLSGTQYTSNGQVYNNLQAALQGSCYSQMNSCQQAANAGGNKGDLTVQNCNGQIQACLAVANQASG